MVLSRRNRYAAPVPDAWTPPNPEYPPPKPGEPPLFRAAREGDHAEIRRLIGAGEDANAVFDIGLVPDGYAMPATPLMVAAGSGDGANLETVRLLIELGADPARVCDGRSAATFAATGLGWNYRPGGDAERLAHVLGVGAPLPGDGRETSRLVAEVARLGDHQRLGVLLAHGAPADAVWDPAVAKAEAENLKRFLERARTQRNEPKEEWERFAEDEIGRAESEFHDRMASAPSDDEIPLFEAARGGSAACVNLLLEAGADLHARDNAGRTAIYYAGSEAVAKLLRDKGLALEDADEYGWSPLASVVSDGEESIDIVRALIAAGADVNATHDHGFTIFMSAVGSGRHPEILRLLIGAGADPHALSDYGYNAFHAAIDVDFAANAEESVRDTLGYLKQLGVDIEHRNKRGHTPLARAIDEGTALEVRVLCELGADPNAPAAFHRCGEDSCGMAEGLPLFAAAESAVDPDQKTEALLRAGADPLATDADGHTPLVQAVAKLCADAADYETKFRAFFAGLAELRGPPDLDTSDRNAYLRAVAPALDGHIRAFAADIPVRRTCKFSDEWRAELLLTIRHLAAYTGWARWQRLA